MNEQDALKKMVPPSKYRNCWRNGILQIMVTRACDKKCYGCTQGSNLGGKPVMMSVAEFEQAVLSLRNPDYFGVFGVFGGNPAMHNRFEEICAVLRKHVPFEQRGLWCNHPLGKGKICRETFNPKVSNLNVHQDQAAYDEFWRDWPEARPVLKGLKTDSRHSPPFVAMSDVGIHEENRWDMIANCDVNQTWSAAVGVVPGRGLRAYFCEVAYAQAALHGEDPRWPDTGLKVEPGWWKKPMADFAAQVRLHCHACGIPLRRFGQLANGGQFEEVSEAHLAIYKPKDKARRVQLVTVEAPPAKILQKATDYISNANLK